MPNKTVFDTNSENLLEEMSIDPVEYSNNLSKIFKKDSHQFDALLSKLTDPNLEFNSYNREVFDNFCSKNNLKDENLINCLLEIYNYVYLFKTSGVYGLYVNRQADGKGPKVVLRPQDVPKHLTSPSWNENTTIYRGLGQDEHSKKEYGQSWTTDLDTAKKFAEQPDGIVVSTLVSKEDVLVSGDPQRTEFEVIVKNRVIKTAEIIQSYNQV